MSALLGVAQRSAIALLTDGATVRAVDGAVACIGGKQFWRDGVAIATTGSMTPCVAFVNAVGAMSFGALVDAAPGFWAGVTEANPPALVGTQYALLLAGWSDKRQRLEMYELSSHEAPDMRRWQPSPSVPCDEAGAATRRFVERFADDVEAFDARGYGLALMHELRQ